MFYTLLSFTFSNLDPNGRDTTSMIIFGTTFLINILISLVMLPINIRLASQLIMQVFKYRYIVKHVATMGEDNQVMIGYYQHFKTIMCIILSMVFFNIFNIISAVYFITYIFTSDWRDLSWFRQIIEGLCAAFNECIILFAVTMLYQIACYFRVKKFSLAPISVVISLRFSYVVLQAVIIDKIILPKFISYISTRVENEYVRILIAIIVLFLILPLSIYETLIRGPMIFSFVRVTQREVSNYIKDFRNDLNTAYLDETHYADKIKAGKLFHIAAWGTISVATLNTISALIEYIAIYIINLYNLSYSNLEYFDQPFLGHTALTKAIIFPTLIAIQLIKILPSILYLLFLITLWLYFRNKTKVKYSGYKQNDPKILRLIDEENIDNAVQYTNQDALHHTFYRPKNKIVLTTYILIIIMASLLFSGFLAPLFSIKWNEIIHLKPGDHYLLKGTELGHRSCPDNLISIEMTQYFYYQAEYKSNNCSQNSFFSNFVKPQQIHFKNKSYHLNSEYFFDITHPTLQTWIPKNSTYVASHSMHLILKTESPCYFATIIQFTNTFSLSVCHTKSSINNQIPQKPAECHPINNNTQVNCTTKYSGMYTLQRYIGYDIPMTVNQFGYKINASTRVPLTRIKGSDFKDHDIIELPALDKIIHPGLLCRYRVTCLSRPIFRVFMPLTILLFSIVYLTVSIFCIHKI